MRNRWLILVALSAFCLTVPATAQDATPPTPAAKAQRNEKAKKGAKGNKKAGGAKQGGKAGRERFERMSEALDLTPEQKLKIEAILKEMKPKVRALQKTRKLTKEQKTAVYLNLQQQQSQRITALLTPEQLEKLKTMRQKRAERKKGKPGRAKKPVKPIA